MPEIQSQFQFSPCNIRGTYQSCTSRHGIFWSTKSFDEFHKIRNAQVLIILYCSSSRQREEDREGAGLPVACGCPRALERNSGTVKQRASYARASRPAESSLSTAGAEVQSESCKGKEASGGLNLHRRHNYYCRIKTDPKHTSEAISDNCRVQAILMSVKFIKLELQQTANKQ